MLETPYTPILRTIVDGFPYAVGAAFVDFEGEAVDAYPDLEREENRARQPSASLQNAWDLRLLGAHWAVILNHVRAAMGTLHHGDAQVVTLHHDHLDVLIEEVADRYFLLLAVTPGVPMDAALKHLHRGVAALREDL